jgi:hypothetical protein
MWMRTMRPSLLQRSHGPSETEDKGQKENKTQKVIDYQVTPPFPLFCKSSTVTIQEVVVSVHAGRTTTSEQIARFRNIAR